MAKSKKQIGLELTNYVRERQAQKFGFNEVANSIGHKTSPVASAKDFVAVMSFEEARKNGWLEAYKDARALNFGRSKSAWAESWSDLVKNSEYYGR